MFWKKKRDTGLDIPMKDAGMVQLCRGLGMPDELITGENVLLLVPSCFFEAYTNGELQTHHAPFKGRMAEWFGHRDFGKGRFVKELVALRDGKRQIDGVDMAAIQGGFAATLASNLATGEGPFSLMDIKQIIPSPVRIEGDKLYFGGNYGQGEYCEQLSRPVNSVLSIEPGIRAIHIINQQLRLGRTNPMSVFQYATISSYPFIARLLPHYLLCRSKQLTGSETLALTLEKQELYRSIQGEITDVTQNLIEGHQQRNQPYEFLDLVLYTSYLPSRLEVASARQAMKNVYQLLRPGGALLIGFPLIDAAPGNASITDLMDAAFSAGFLQEKARAHIGTSNMANARIPLFTLFVKEGE
jgi:hypothetical protein